MDQGIFATLLLVEDEDLVLELLTTLLEEGGYRVLPAPDAKTAIEILERDRNSIGGLVTDINLGKGLRGWDVAHRARELNASIPVVYTTGDSAHEWPVLGVPGSVLLQKPFAPPEVVVAISTLRAKGPAL